MPPDDPTINQSIPNWTGGPSGPPATTLFNGWKATLEGRDALLQERTEARADAEGGDGFITLPTVVPGAGRSVDVGSYAVLLGHTIIRVGPINVPIPAPGSDWHLWATQDGEQLTPTSTPPTAYGRVERIAGPINAGSTVLLADIDTSNRTRSYLADYALHRAVSVDLSGGDVALTDDESRCSLLVLTGALTADRVVTIPDGLARHLAVANTTTGAHTVTVTTESGVGVMVPGGGIPFLVSNGTDVSLPMVHADQVSVGTLDAARVPVGYDDDVLEVDVTAGTVDLSAADARLKIIRATGTPSTGRTITLPDGLWWRGTVVNECGHTLTFKTATGGSQTVADGASKDLWSNGVAMQLPNSAVI